MVKRPVPSTKRPVLRYNPSLASPKMPGRRDHRAESTPAPQMDRRMCGMVAARVANAFLQQSTGGNAGNRAPSSIGGNAGNRAPSEKRSFRLVDVFSSTNSEATAAYNSILTVCKESHFWNYTQTECYKNAKEGYQLFEQCKAKLKSVQISEETLADLFLDSGVRFTPQIHISYLAKVITILRQIKAGLDKPKRDRSGVLLPQIPQAAPPAAHPAAPPAAHPAAFSKENDALMRFLEEERAARKRLEEQLATLLQGRVRSPPRAGSSSSSTAAPRNRTFVSNGAAVLQEARQYAATGVDLPRSASMGRMPAWSSSRPGTPPSWEDQSW